MKQKKKMLSIMLTFILTFMMLLNSIAVQAAEKQTIVPNVDYVNAPTLEYTAGDIVNFDLHAPNYGGKVQYRVLLWDDNKKEARDLWATGDRYYTNWMPYGNNTFNLHWRIDEPGSYRITVYVKRAGIQNSNTVLKGYNCDSYMESQAFVVNSKTTAFDKDGQTYGSVDENNVEAYNKDINITGKNVTFNNAKLEGNLTITGDNAVIRNVNVVGNLVVDPGKDGSCTLENVTAKDFKVLSGGQNSIHIKDSNIETMNVNSESPIRIEVDGDTEIVSTTANGYVIFDRKNGTFGTITITKDENGESVIEFCGDIQDKVEVETAATIKTGQGSSMANLVINTGNNTDVVKLEGQFDKVEITSKAKVEVGANTKIQNVIANSDTEIKLDKTSSITNVEKSGNEVVINGEGQVGSDTTPVNSGGSSSDGGGHGTSTVAVSAITITGAGNATTITTDNGTLQMSATVLPTNATNSNVTWAVTPGTGTASISAGGLLTALTNGTVTVKATSVSTGTVNNTLVITISNQILATSPLASFTPVTLTQTGDIANNNVQYANAAAVIAALPTEVAIILVNSTVVNVPVTWSDTDIYDAGTAAAYTFTATWGTMPVGADNANSLAVPTVVVVVAAGANAAQLVPTGLAGVAPTSVLTDGKITGTTVDMEYRLKGATDFIACSATETAVAAAGTYEVRLVAKTGYNAGATAEVVVAAYVAPNEEQLAPTGLAGVAPTSALTDGKITGTTVDMEYKLATGGTYAACSATETTVAAAGEYVVRLAAKTGYNAGATAEVVVAAYVAPDTTPADSTSGITSQVTGALGSKQVTLTITVKNAAGDSLTDLIATDFNVQVKFFGVEQSSGSLGVAPFSDFANIGDGTYAIIYTGTSNYACYYFSNLTVKGVVIEAGPTAVYIPAAVAPILESATVSNNGTTITLDFDKTMLDPTNSDIKLTFSAVVNDEDRTFSATALNTDNTKIDLTLSGLPIIQGVTVTLSYIGGMVGSTDFGFLAKFNDMPVTNSSTVLATKSLKTFTAVMLTQTGDVANNNVQYADAAAVIAALPTTITVTLEDDTTTAVVPVTWADTDTYTKGTAGDYTFTATWGEMPAGADNADAIVAPTVEVTVTQGILADVQLTSLAENLTADLSPAFIDGTYAYTLAATSVEVTVDVTPTLEGATITWNVDTDVEGNPATVISGVTASIPLVTGENVITIHVEKAGTTAKDYVITVTKAL